MFRWVTAFFIFTVHFYAFANCEIPADADWAFARALFKSEMSLLEKRSALVDACAELDRRRASGEYVQTPQSVPYLALRALSSVWVNYRSAASAFTILGGSAVQEAFKARLDEIKKDPRPMARIQQVYESVLFYQGDTQSHYTLDNPGQMLDRVKETGAGGTCRDFANLLYWSLLQVARPSGVESRLGEMGETSFSVELPTGVGDINGQWSGEVHVWVRVNIPKRRHGQLVFESFDLDTTNYKSRFTPLMIRYQGLSDQELSRLHGRCLEIVQCLNSVL